MPSWTNRPPKDPRGHALPLIRTPANGRLTLHVTSPNLVGCPTHWFGGRTVPCEGANCPACQEGVPWRWHGYLSALIHPTRRHVICEFTAQAAEQILNYRDAQGTLRGCILTAARHRNRHNGRVLLNLTPGPLQQMNLPDAPHVTDCMSIIWNIPAPEINLPDGRRHIPRDPKKNSPPALRVTT